MVRELKSFLRRVSYINKFVPGLASVINGLFKLLKKGVEFVWRTKQQEAFHESSSHPTDTSMWAAPVAIFGIKLPGYKSPANTEDNDGNE